MLSCLLLFMFSGDAAPSAGWLVDKQERALGQIQSLRATIECRVSSDGGRDWRFLYRFNIARSGTKQRFRRMFSASLVDGKYVDATDFADFLDTPDGKWSMAGIDPEHPPAEPVSITDLERSGRRIGGTIAPAAPFFPGGYKNQWMFSILFHPGMSTLREMLKFTGNVSPSEGKSAAGGQTWELRLRSREGRSHLIALDPKYNYMISKNERTVGKYHATMEVAEFQEPKPGIFIAKLIRDIEHNPDQLVEYTIKDVAVNEPIPEEEFVLRFPVGIPVADDRTNVIHIWGDGKPAMTLGSRAEYDKWRVNQMAASMRKPSGSLAAKLAVVGGATAALAALIYLRRRMMASKQAA